MDESLCTFAKEKGVKKAERTSWVIKDSRVSGLEKEENTFSSNPMRIICLTKHKGYLRLMPHNPEFKPIIIDADDQFILQGKVTSIHRDTRKC